MVTPITELCLEEGKEPNLDVDDTCAIRELLGLDGKRTLENLLIPNKHVYHGNDCPANLIVSINILVVDLQYKEQVRK